MPNEKSLIDIFENNELQVGVLYRLYAKKIPSRRNFWNKIAEEEVSHAQEIARNFQKEKECFKENKFVRGIVNHVSGFIEEKILEAKNKKITHLVALENALRIEQSMLEKKCFDIFIPSNVTIKKVLERLNRDTERHVSMLRKEYEKSLKN